MKLIIVHILIIKCVDSLENIIKAIYIFMCVNITVANKTFKNTCVFFFKLNKIDVINISFALLIYFRVTKVYIAHIRCSFKFGCTKLFIGTKLIIVSILNTY